MSVIPIVASIDDLASAIRIGDQRPSCRWYIAKRAEALNAANMIPDHWGVTAPSSARVQSKRRRSRALTAAGWSPDLHPRDRKGRWIEKLDLINVFQVSDGTEVSFRGIAVGNGKTPDGHEYVDVHPVGPDGKKIGTSTHQVPVDRVESAPASKARLTPTGAEAPSAGAPDAAADAGTPDVEKIKLDSHEGVQEGDLIYSAMTGEPRWKVTKLHSAKSDGTRNFEAEDLKTGKNSSMSFQAHAPITVGRAAGGGDDSEDLDTPEGADFNDETDEIDDEADLLDAIDGIADYSTNELQTEYEAVTADDFTGAPEYRDAVVDAYYEAGLADDEVDESSGGQDDLGGTGAWNGEPPTTDDEYSQIILNEAQGYLDEGDPGDDPDLEANVDKLRSLVQAMDQQQAGDAADVVRQQLLLGYADEGDLPERPETDENAGAAPDFGTIEEQNFNLAEDLYVDEADVVIADDQGAGLSPEALDQVRSLKELLDVDSGLGSWASGLSNHQFESLGHYIEDWQDDPESVPPWAQDALNGAQDAANELEIDDVYDVVAIRAESAKLGWSVEEQLRGILDGDNIDEYNSNAVRKAAEFLQDLGHVGNFDAPTVGRALKDYVQTGGQGPIGEKTGDLVESGSEPEAPEPDSALEPDVAEGDTVRTTVYGIGGKSDVVTGKVYKTQTNKSGKTSVWIETDSGHGKLVVEPGKWEKVEPEVPSVPESAPAAPSAPDEPSGVGDAASLQRLGMMTKSANKASSKINESDAEAELNSIISDLDSGGDRDAAHKRLAGLMTKMSLGGKQRKRYREALDSYTGSDDDSSAETEAAAVADNLSPNNPVKEKLAAKASGGAAPSGEAEKPGFYQGRINLGDPYWQTSRDDLSSDERQGQIDALQAERERILGGSTGKGAAKQNAQQSLSFIDDRLKELGVETSTKPETPPAAQEKPTTPGAETQSPAEAGPDLKAMAAQMYDFEKDQKTASSKLPPGVKKVKVDTPNLTHISNRYRTNAKSANDIEVDGVKIGTVMPGKVGGSVMSGKVNVGWQSESSGWLAFDQDMKEVKGVGLTAQNAQEAIALLLRKAGENDTVRLGKLNASDASDEDLARIMRRFRFGSPQYEAARAERGKRRGSGGSSTSNAPNAAPAAKSSATPPKAGDKVRVWYPAEWNALNNEVTRDGEIIKVQGGRYLVKDGYRQLWVDPEQIQGPATGEASVIKKGPPRPLPDVKPTGKPVSTPAGPVDVGDVITYTANGGEKRRILVTEVMDNIKNGEPGFSGEPVNPDGTRNENAVAGWGYADQADTIESKGKA